MRIITFDIDKLFETIRHNQHNMLSRQVRRGLLYRVQKGLPVGPVPLGYRLKRKKIVIVEPTATHIRTIFRQLAEGGIEPKTVRKEAIKAGLISKKRKPLSASAFHYLVRNPFYAGYITLGGQRYKGAHEPLVLEEDFRKAQRAIGR